MSDDRKALNEAAQRINNNNWECVEELLDSVPETADKEILADKYYWKAIFYRDCSNDLEKAEYYLKLIDESWDQPTYAAAQYRLALIFKNRGANKLAKDYWLKIKKEHSLYFYSKAQFQFGRYYRNQRKYDKAVKHFKNSANSLKELDDKTAYYHLLRWIANTYRSIGDSDNALKYLEQIPETNKKAYAWVVFEKYRLDLVEIKDLEQIERAWNEDAYQTAQYCLANFEWNQGNEKKAITHWSNIDKDTNPDIYRMSQLNLLEKAVPFLVKEGQYTKIEKLLETIKLPDLQYNVSIYKRIIALNLQSNLAKEMLQLYNKINTIKNTLQIKRETLPDDLKPYCRKFSHYTRASTAKTIMGADQKSVGTLQLSVADLMNDPTEGKILFSLLEEIEWLRDRFNHRNYQAYATCFSFNHDSLNQFRLYGKEEGKEATGVSMVFDLEMFSEKKYSENIDSISNAEMDIGTSDNSYISKHQNSQKTSPMKLPLYRCVYYDPKSGYYKLAHRAEMTFFREGEIAGLSSEEIKKNWKAYRDFFIKTEETLTKLFNEIKMLIKRIRNRLEKVDKRFSTPDKKKPVIALINDLLLPIKFLIKHAAFIEEDECRMIYIVGAGSESIKKDNGRLYIEYEPSVIQYLDKIYLSDGAKDERAFLERAWQRALDRDYIKDKTIEKDKTIDVRDSDNPFRTY